MVKIPWSVASTWSDWEKQALEVIEIGVFKNAPKTFNDRANINLSGLESLSFGNRVTLCFVGWMWRFGPLTTFKQVYTIVFQNYDCSIRTITNHQIEINFRSGSRQIPKVTFRSTLFFRTKQNFQKIVKISSEDLQAHEELKTTRLNLWHD